ncbi:DNA ligase [Methylomarinum vadi]|uniref:DNA ligase n=1 Tax=Methylomarinum vadi TaxID=438855 RepID=UPI0004DFAF15|nr:DNA ligase [Methylomarinum vadi]
MKSAHRISYLYPVILFILLTVSLARAVDKPAIMQAEVYQPSVDVAQYWVSEKLDGVRARWDGRQLISRNGNVFHAPAWFSKDFPDRIMDGELWSARGQYQTIVSIVSRHDAHDGWRKIKLMVFDLPDVPGPFSARVDAMRRMANTNHSPYLQFIDQFRVASHEALMLALERVTGQGGEGLMLHHQDAHYRFGRSKRLLKLKRYQDEEAIVIGYRPGKGQFSGMMGAVKVKTEDDKEFYIGSGFTKQERQNPPPLGSRITFRYQGFTDNGLPRFAVFMRIREEP